jgi:hypothetical protein
LGDELIQRRRKDRTKKKRKSSSGYHKKINSLKKEITKQLEADNKGQNVI